MPHRSEVRKFRQVLKLGIMNSPTKMPKAELRRVLKRAHLPHDLIREVLKELPDPVDFDRDSAVLDRHGLTRDRVTDLMGGSP